MNRLTGANEVSLSYSMSVSVSTVMGDHHSVSR